VHARAPRWSACPASRWTPTSGASSRPCRSSRPPPTTAATATPKTVQGELGEVRLDTPRDRGGTFEPKLIGRYPRRPAGFDEEVLAPYAQGLTTRDIPDVVAELHGVEASPTLVSEVVAGLDEEVAVWRSRRLDPVWPIVSFDGIVVHVRGDGGRVSQHTMHVALGVNLEGRKELLGLWLGEAEGATFWLPAWTG
jgi:putative transposase